MQMNVPFNSSLSYKYGLNAHDKMEVFMLAPAVLFTMVPASMQLLWRCLLAHHGFASLLLLRRKSCGQIVEMASLALAAGQLEV
jgi:hypothetical protein